MVDDSELQRKNKTLTGREGEMKKKEKARACAQWKYYREPGLPITDKFSSLQALFSQRSTKQMI